MESKLIASNPHPIPLTEVFDFLHLCKFDPHKKIAKVYFTRGAITVK